jgi:hypothetical protein
VFNQLTRVDLPSNQWTAFLNYLLDVPGAETYGRNMLERRNSTDVVEIRAAFIEGRCPRWLASVEAWLDFRNGEKVDYSVPLCFYCGEPCSGDVTETVVIYDDQTAEKPICDIPEDCMAN